MKMADKVFKALLPLLVGLSCFISTSSCSSTRQCKEFLLDSLPQHLQIRQPVAFCFVQTNNTSPLHAWGSVQVTFDRHSGRALENMKLHKADSCEALSELQNQTVLSQLRSWLLDTDSFKHKVLHLNPFKTTCIGLQPPTSSTYQVSISLEFKRVHWQFPLAFLGGLLVFHSADTLSRNALFFYTSGVTVGVLGCLLIIVFILYRMIPHKPSGTFFLLTGWSGTLFLLQYTVNNMYDLLMKNNQIVISYVLAAGTISFAICYYYGPVTSDRGLDLARWTLQAIGLSLLYMGTQSEEVSIAVVLLVLTVHVLRNTGISMYLYRMLPNGWVSYRLVYFFHRPKIRLLTQEEYTLQGTEETKRALEELRGYCSSPECNAWRVVSRLQRPGRFADFISEGQHFTADEIRAYEVDSPFMSVLTDDEEDSDGTGKDES